MLAPATCVRRTLSYRFRRCIPPCRHLSPGRLRWWHYKGVPSPNRRARRRFRVDNPAHRRSAPSPRTPGHAPARPRLGKGDGRLCACCGNRSAGRRAHLSNSYGSQLQQERVHFNLGGRRRPSAIAGVAHRAASNVGKPAEIRLGRAAPDNRRLIGLRSHGGLPLIRADHGCRRRVSLRVFLIGVIGAAARAASFGAGWPDEMPNLSPIPNDPAR